VDRKVTVKRSVDIVVSLAALILFAPLMFSIALLVRLTRNNEHFRLAVDAFLRSTSLDELRGLIKALKGDMPLEALLRARNAKRD